MNYNLSTTWTVILILGVLWELAWKGAALWKSARNNQSGWFLAILIINSAGILPIVYLLMQKTERSGKYAAGASSSHLKGTA